MILGMNLPLSKDGILYDCNDQVKVACNDCEGCQEGMILSMSKIEELRLMRRIRNEEK